MWAARSPPHASPPSLDSTGMGPMGPPQVLGIRIKIAITGVQGTWVQIPVLPVFGHVT